MENLHKLEKAVRPEAGTSMDEIRNCLEPTYTHLTEHFRLEEKDGFLDDLRRCNPRFERITLELFNEHRDLMWSINEIRGEILTESRVNEDLREKIQTWIGQVRRHERRETDLIQEAVDTDIGTKD